MYNRLAATNITTPNHTHDSTWRSSIASVAQGWSLLIEIILAEFEIVSKM